jgi:hypothetical protein
MVSLNRIGWLRCLFRDVNRREEQEHGEYRTRHVILEIYDAMAEAIRTGHPYQSLRTIPPGIMQCSSTLP